MTTVPDLHFGPDVSATGFTPAGISGFSELRSAAVIRELIQNSLDAALIEANEKRAHIRFRKFTCNLSKIPGIESYKEAFRLAKESQTLSGSQRMPTQAKLVVDRIGGALCKKSHSVLAVTDNGVGLNERRMAALLSDGVSEKSGNAAGTFGNGHSVAIPASDLRYILYGGATKEGNILGGGHAVLASHRIAGEKHGRSAHGLFITSFNARHDGVPFTFACNSHVPELIAREIADIRKRHYHGTAVIIPAFNDFEDRRTLWDKVARAAACNFFQAISNGHLVVEVDDPDEGGRTKRPDVGIRVLNSATLVEVLKKFKDELRSDAFLAGRKANEAYMVLTQGATHDVPTSHGEVSLKLLLRESGKHSVGLCRNGMWITDDMPRFRNFFNDRRPFQALILLDPGRKNSFYDLVQEAETPLHNRLAPRQMMKERQRELLKALEEIRDWIRIRVPEAKSESYSPDDVLAFQFNGAEAQGPGGRQTSFWGKPETTRKPVERPIQVEGTADGGGSSDINGGKGGNGDKGSGAGPDRPKNGKKLSVAIPFFRVASVPAGPRKRRIYVECERECNNAELRVFVDENVDATCDRQASTHSVGVLLSDVSIDGKPASLGSLVNGDQGTLGVKLGKLDAGSAFVLETEYEVPDSVMTILPGVPPTLRVEIRARTSSAKSEKSGKPCKDATPDG